MNSRTHKAAQAALARAVERDVARLFPRFDLARIAETWPEFRRAALLLIQSRGKTSAGLAYAYFRAARRSAGIPGVAPPMRATPAAEAILAGLDAMGPENVAKQLSLGRVLVDVREATLINLTGVATKFVLDHGRDVVLHATQDDPRARGWSRDVGSTACEFCQMLGGRGAVYRSEESASFQSHRHCTCSAAPAW